jgi:hypothetical protein
VTSTLTPALWDPHVTHGPPRAHSVNEPDLHSDDDQLDDDLDDEFDDEFDDDDDFDDEDDWEDEFDEDFEDLEDE